MKNFRDIKLFSKITLNYAHKNVYGFGSLFLSNFKSRLELREFDLLDTNMPSKWSALINTIKILFPQKVHVKSKALANIFMLDILQTYKGWRHAKGLPVRGQRTWTNAWSSFRSNLVLRKFKIKIAQKIFTQLSVSDVSTAYLAEQINMLWKVQWESEWKAAKKNRLRLTRQGGAVKADLVGMAKGHVVSPQKLKKMNKKQKQALKKNSFSLGFDPGFTKKIIEDLYKTKLMEQSKRKQSRNTLVSLNEIKKGKGKVKKKKMDLRAQKIKHNLKKKSKKSVWD